MEINIFLLRVTIILRGEPLFSQFALNSWKASVQCSYDVYHPGFWDLDTLFSRLQTLWRLYHHVLTRGRFCAAELFDIMKEQSF